jgi:acyl carrier protein
MAQDTPVQEIKARVREFAEQNLLGDLDKALLTDEASFERLHLTDSVRALDVIVFVEETFAIRVENDEALPENFDSIDNIARFVRKKLEAA